MPLRLAGSARAGGAREGRNNVRALPLCNKRDAQQAGGGGGEGDRHQGGAARRKTKAWEGRELVG